MRYLLFLMLTLLFSNPANSSRTYPCSDSPGSVNDANPTCSGTSSARMIKAGLSQPQELVGRHLDETMWVLLEEPYKSDDKQFIEYVQKYRLLQKQDRDGDTVLSIAALNGQVAVIDYLASNGIEIDRTNKLGNTVFDHAIKLNSDVREALLKHGANINHAGVDGRTPLINAIVSDDLATVKFLLAHGADIDHVDAAGINAMQYATYMGNVEIVNSLLQAGIDEKSDSNSEPL
jgi:ankyrin repeat protein